MGLYLITCSSFRNCSLHASYVPRWALPGMPVLAAFEIGLCPLSLLPRPWFLFPSLSTLISQLYSKWGYLYDLEIVSRNTTHSAVPHSAPSAHRSARRYPSKTLERAPLFKTKDHILPGNWKPLRRTLLRVQRDMCPHLLTTRGPWPSLNCGLTLPVELASFGTNLVLLTHPHTYSHAQSFLWTKITETLPTSSTMGPRRRTAKTMCPQIQNIYHLTPSENICQILA